LRHLSALATLGAVTFAACPGTRVDPPADALTTPEAVIETARQYIAAGPGEAVIEARASQYSDRGGLKGKLLILAQRPGRLRLEGLSPTDDTVSVLATDAERFTAFQRGSDVCWTGRACPENVGRFASIPLESDELVGVLLGRPPLIPHREASLKWDASAGAYRLELVGDAGDLGMAHGRTQRLWVAHGDGRILRTSLVEDGKTRVDVTYSEWRRLGGRLVPGRLDIQMARDETDLRLDYRDIDLAPALAAEAFVFTCPGGTTLEELTCRGD
jgi:hypothetical protein